MIFNQSSKQYANHQRNDIFNSHQMRGKPQVKEKHLKTEKQEEKNTCSCFWSKKDKTKHLKDQNLKFQTSPDYSHKEEALELSRQLAQKNFKHLKSITSLPKNIFSQNNTFQSTKVSIQNISKTQSSQQAQKNLSKQSQNLSKHQQKVTESEKDEFNMSRITFSAINKSYQKTVSNTISSNNTSISFDNNILGSVVSQVKNDSERVKSQKLSDQSFSFISSLSRKNSGNRIRSSELHSKKAIKILKTKPQIEPIAEQNQQVETKKYKFIRVKAKDFPLKSIKESEKMQIRKIETVERLVSSQSIENLDNTIKYDYSSVVIDFFNMDQQMLEEMQKAKRKESYQDGQQSKQRIFIPSNLDNDYCPNSSNQLECLPQSGLFSLSQQTSLSELTSSYKPLSSLSASNFRPLFTGSGLSSDSNLLSMSINNNFSECSFDSIAKREIKWGVGFDGLSCINQNEESQVEGKNQSSQLEIHREQSLYS